MKKPAQPRQPQAFDRTLNLERRLSAVRKSDVPSLQKAHRSLHGDRTPVPVSRGELELSVTVGLQRLLIAKLRSKLVQIGLGADAMLAITDSDSRNTDMLRGWRRRIYLVTVDEGGVVYDGRLYRSLDAVARKITGNRVSGHDFFHPQSQRKSP